MIPSVGGGGSVDQHRSYRRADLVLRWSQRHQAGGALCATSASGRPRSGSVGPLPLKRGSTGSRRRACLPPRWNLRPAVSIAIAAVEGVDCAPSVRRSCAAMGHGNPVILSGGETPSGSVISLQRCRNPCRMEIVRGATSARVRRRSVDTPALCLMRLAARAGAWLRGVKPTASSWSHGWASRSHVEEGLPMLHRRRSRGGGSASGG